MAKHAGHRRLWWVALALFIGGLALSTTVLIVAWVPGLLLLAVAGGLTASAGPTASPARLALAWSVPVLTTLVTLATVVYLAFATTEPLLVYLVGLALVITTLAVWAGFGLAAGVEAVRTRRRFVEPDAAWETGPSPSPYS